MLKELSVSDFIKELASNSPAPGGGSVAALSASLASALTSMVFNLTVGKKMFNEYDDTLKEDITTSLNVTNSLKDEFLDLMNTDMEEFLSLMAAFKLPKSTEAEAAERDEKIAAGYKRALEVPLLVAEKSHGIYKYILIACTYGNKNAVSDAGVAALLLQTAIESAVLNVYINLSSVKEEEYKKEVKDKCQYLISNGEECKKNIMEVVYSKL